jgi:hypothetical protein
VTSGDVGAVSSKLGTHVGQTATSAFLHGYRVAITTCTVALLLAAVSAYVGLHRRARAATGEVSPATS